MSNTTPRQTDNATSVPSADVAENPVTTVKRVWSEGGVLVLEAEMTDGRYHGRYASWWENGNRREEGRFYRGICVGLYRWYSERGGLLKEEDYGPGIL